MAGHRVIGVVVMASAGCLEGLLVLSVITSVRQDQMSPAWAVVLLLLPIPFFLWGLGIWHRRGRWTCLALLGILGCLIAVGLGVVFYALTTRPLVLPLACAAPLGLSVLARWHLTSKAQPCSLDRPRWENPQSEPPVLASGWVGSPEGTGELRSLCLRGGS